MGARVLEFDWSKTPLGAIDEWPRSLLTLVHMIVSSRHPMLLFWGPKLVQIYNDGYRSSLGEDRDRGALGARGEEFWGDIWAIIGADVQGVMERGESVWYENRLVPIVRNNRVEEVYWTYSYSPVLDDAGSIGGTLVTVREVTSDVLRERRASTLRTVADRAAVEASTAEDVSRIVSEALSDANADIAFALLYLLDEDAALRLYHPNEALPAGAQPLTVPFGARFPDASVWPLAEVVETGEPQFIGDLRDRIGVLPGGCWPEAADSALALPVSFTETGQVLGVLITGLSPRLGLDHDYRGFLDLLARQIAAAITNARERAEASRRETAARERLEHAMEQAPAALCLFQGPEHIFTLANPRYLEIIGNRDVVGQPVREALPEVAGQGYFELLDAVFASGEPYVGTEQRVVLDPDTTGTGREVYVNFVYAPTRGTDGEVDGIFVHVYDVTPQVEARLAAEEAARARDTFLSIASHELRNPVAALNGTAQFLARAHASGRLTEARLVTYIQALDTAGRQLARLTDDLLDISRLHHGELRLRPEQVDLAELVRDLIRRGEWGGHQVTLEIDKASMEATLDPYRVRQVIENLLDNAVKYSPDAQEVRVYLSRDAAGVRLEVRDHGIGMHPDSIDSIFKPFGRAPNATEANIPGLGLGLYLSRSIAEQHGGRLWATSEGEGRGTVMHLWLPARGTDHPAASQSP